MKKFLKIILFFFSMTIIFGLFFLEKKESKEKEVFIKEPEDQKENKLSKEEEILNAMTIEEKIGQLLIVGFKEKNFNSEIENLIKKIKPAGLLFLARNIESENQLKKITKDLQTISLKETKLPLFIAVDQEGEPLSRVKFLKEKTGQSEIKDEKEAFEIGFKRGKELKNLGINLNLAPVLDVANKGDFIYSRSFQKNPEISGKIAKFLISGQKKAGILSGAKHFPGYGKISFDPEREKLPYLEKIPEIFQFQIAIEAEPEMIMVSNVVYKEIDEKLPFSFSQKGIEFLKKELGDNFLIISDDLSSPVLKKEFSLEKSLFLAFEAGIDLLIVAGFDNPEDVFKSFDFLLRAAKEGKISKERINQSVFKIIHLKEKMLK